MELFIGCDHAGYKLKMFLKDFLPSKCTINDVGCIDSTTSVDYPDYAKTVANYVVDIPHSRGILICGTGIGMSITANKINGIRAALCNDVVSAEMSRKHNNANILVLGSRIIGNEIAKAIVHTWLNTPFSGEKRHINRIEKITTIEDQRFASGFKKGQEAVKRRNKSGCCCVINDNDEVERVCSAHEEWLKNNITIKTIKEGATFYALGHKIKINSIENTFENKFIELTCAPECCTAPFGISMKLSETDFYSIFGVLLGRDRT